MCQGWESWDLVLSSSQLLLSFQHTVNQKGSLKANHTILKRSCKYSRTDFLMMAFSSLARTLGEGSMMHSLAFFFLEWKSAWAHQFHFLGQHQSTVD